jgi:hypothetical protein
MEQMGDPAWGNRMGFPRRTTIYVVIGTLLLCPYTCLGRAAVVAETAGCARDCPDDDCCPPTPASDSGKDRPSDSGRQGGACLCHGAVLQSPASVPEVDAGPAAPVAAADLPAVTRSSLFGDRLFAVGHSICHFPSADSGRAVRALIASLLL